MNDSKCLFCKLIEERSIYIIDENEHCIAFLDKYPVSEGHILISTKQHFEVFQDIKDQLILIDLINLISKVSMKVTNVFKTDYNIHQSNGENAEQSVKHVHFHIIPRTESDNVKIELPAKKYIDMKQIYKVLINN